MIKRIYFWFCAGLFITLVVTKFVQHSIEISTTNPSIKLALSSFENQTSTQYTAADFLNKLAAVYCPAQDRFGYMNTAGKLTVPMCFDEVEPFSNEVALVTVPGKSSTNHFGYINREGAFVIPPTLTFQQFEQSQVVWKFSEDRLPLRRESKGQIGYINKKGKFVVAPQFDEAKPFSEGLAGVCWYQEPVTKHSERRCGYIDLQGNTVIKSRFASVGSFQNGVAVVLMPANQGETGRLGVIDKKGNPLIEPNLDFIDQLDRYSVGSSESRQSLDASFHSGLLRVRIPDSEFPPSPQDTSIPQDIFGTGKWGYVRKAGRYAIKPRFRQATNFSEGRAAVVIDKDDDEYPANWRGKWVLIDTFGRIIDTREQNPQPEVRGMPWFKDENFGFKNGIAVALANNDRYGFLNLRGKWVIAPRFTKLRAFAEGLAAAQDADNRKWGYINRQGWWVIQPQFGIDPQFHAAEVFSQRLAAAQSAKNGRWGYINQKGEYIISPQFDDADPFLTNGFARVKVGDRYGLINRRGKYVLSPKYKSISDFVDGIAGGLSEEGFYLFVTASGKLLPYIQAKGHSQVSEGLIAVSGRLPSNFRP